MSDHDLHKLLRENIKIARENQRILKKIRRGQVNRSIMKYLYWVVIIVLTIAGYYAVLPYIETVQNSLDEVRTGIDSIGDAGDSIKGLLDFSKE